MEKSGNYWYYLDEDGYMATSKLIENGDEKDNIFYVDESGRMVANQWVELDNDDYYDNSDDDKAETAWYYFQSSGKAYKTSGKTSFKTINNKKYAFNAKGEMLSGLWSLKVNDENEITGLTEFDKTNNVDGISAFVANGYKVYYFGSSEDGAMKTGNQNVEVDGKKYQFAFGKSGDEKGQGINKVQNNDLYVQDKKIKADTDYRYQVVDIKGDVVKKPGLNQEVSGCYLVNTSGAVRKSSASKYTDSEGYQFTVGAKDEDTGTYTVKYIGLKKYFRVLTLDGRWLFHRSFLDLCDYLLIIAVVS